MAARRRPATSRRKHKKLPPWALVLMGLGVGLAIAWAAHLYSTRSAARNESVHVDTGTAAQSTAKKPENKTAAPAKPRFDFYTILPEVETVLPEREPRKSAAREDKTEKNVRYVLQAASFGNFEDADRLKARLALSGLEAQIEKVTIEGRGEYYRVRLGPYASLAALEAPNRQLAQLGIKPIRLKVKAAPGG